MSELEDVNTDAELPDPPEPLPQAGPQVAVLRLSGRHLEVLTKLVNAGIPTTVQNLNDVRAAAEISDLLQYAFSQLQGPAS